MRLYIKHRLEDYSLFSRRYNSLSIYAEVLSYLRVKIPCVLSHTTFQVNTSATATGIAPLPSCCQPCFHNMLTPCSSLGYTSPNPAQLITTKSAEVAMPSLPGGLFKNHQICTCISSAFGCKLRMY